MAATNLVMQGKWTSPAPAPAPAAPTPRRSSTAAATPAPPASATNNAVTQQLEQPNTPQLELPKDMVLADVHGNALQAPRPVRTCAAATERGLALLHAGRVSESQAQRVRASSVCRQFPLGCCATAWLAGSFGKPRWRTHC